MRCDGSPDPTEQGEINTYINLRLEDNENDSIEMVLKKCELDSSVSIIGMNQTKHFVQTGTVKPALVNDSNKALLGSSLYYVNFMLISLYIAFHIY